MNVQKLLGRICILGAIIVCVVSGCLVLLFFASGQDFFPPPIPKEDRFTRRLREYDEFVQKLPSLEDKAAAARIIRRLDSLEKNARGMEAHLSVIKRRRFLALEQRVSRDASAGYLRAYQKAAERIAAAFPYFDLPAAVAAEALILTVKTEREFPFAESGGPGASPLSGEDAEKVEQYASRISDPALASLSLDLYILSGALKDPRRAMTIPRGEEVLFRAASGAASVEGESLVIDAALLRLLKGDAPGAGAFIRSLIEPSAQERGIPVSRKGMLFAAEFFYDFGDPRRSAELFSRFNDEESLVRQADALWLAGNSGSARNLWLILSSPDQKGPVSDSVIRSLYNLAVTAPNKAAEAAYLERLLRQESRYTYGVIRYTRLLDAPRAAALMEDSGLLEAESLIGLEWLRRKQGVWTIDRIIPETWRLLDRYGDDPAIYQWAAYYFDLQRRYDESATLLNHARRKGLDGAWIAVHQGLALIRQGKAVAGFELLRSTVPETGASVPAVPWQVSANIGRVLEAERSYATALEYYEIAVSGPVEPVDAAKIQLRISRCLRALGRERESRRVLEYARTLDPENLSIRLELGWPEDGIFVQ